MTTSKGRPPLGILPHSAFKEAVGAATLERYRLDPRTRVSGEAAFREMKDYLVKHYQGVEAESSFEDSAGSVFDCIPIAQQPSLRGHRGELPQPADLTPLLQGRRPEPRMPAVGPQEVNVPRDRHGNPRQAPPGTIPMRRVTLDELVRFPDLRQFFRKYPPPGSPVGALTPSAKGAKTATQAPSAPDPDPNKNHRYAYTHQTVDNLGAHNSLAVYAPAVDSNQVFSLAQHWYGGGDGANHQTVEVGWQVYPVKYGHAQPVLFIFWTADNYVSTGAYNLDAPGFVQTNGKWTIGGALSPVSVQGGDQNEIEVAIFLLSGNWWLYMGGLAAENAVGYYPTSLYGSGQLATNATEILFGGETVTSAVSWPPMGSGALASAGYGQAAYQRNIYYFPLAGGTQWASLTPEQPSLACYTLALNSAAAPWGVYFYFGGPGGGDC
jgi:hypothetical protein